MKTILLSKSVVLIVFLLSCSSFAQTNVSGGIYSNTTWTKAKSPYIVTDTIVVFPGVTLTIEPGVTVKFADNKRLEIRQGKLIAVGTKTDSITFTSNAATPTQGIWSEIFLKSSTISKFNYCNFRYAKHGIYNDEFGSTNDTLIVKNSNFNYNDFGIYNWYISSINEFDSCNFMNNKDGFYTEYHITPIVVNYCNFSYNQNNGFSGPGSGYRVGYLNNCYASYNKNIGIQADTIYNSIILHNEIGIGSGFIKNCTIQYNNFGISGGDMVDSSVISNNQHGIDGGGEIKNSIIDSNSVVGIYYSFGDITNCEIKYNGTGIDLGDSINTITKNIIENNTIGIVLGANNNIYCNKICNNTSYDLKYTMTKNFNVTNNYWCTTDSATIASHIYDGYDNINLGLVSFMPLDTQQCYLSTGIVLNEKQNFSFTIFPNPASDYITVQLPATSSKTEVKIFNLLGELEFSYMIAGNKANIDVSALAKGMHILEITTANTISRQKLIKQ